MSDLNSLLEPDEKVVFRTRVHAWVFITPGVVFLWIVVFLPNILLLAGFGLITLLYGVFQYTYSEYILTNRKLIKRSGYYYIRTEEYPVEKIDSVILWQNYPDRILGTGVVILLGVGMITKKIYGIARAKDFRNAIHSQLSTEPEHYFD